ncbi:hypothetical protein [Microbispora hainanensis]|uniref:DUF624 domain-containing protein n=1 Tax=Microbispora hainanensis TaxID=568844 RepID=A0A544Y314_9ACTN|nr:hypothetical protein [Microbispora hainanensis]TQS11103.1 hypothetical protein FLX08_37495 [Microbispora hainanensis]
MTETTIRRFGQGPLSRVSALVYTLLVVELLVVATTLPGLAGLVLLDRDAANVPLAAVCALPAGPALSAALYALYALHRRRPDLTDLHPASAFWRGYRMNAGGVLKLYVPWLAGLTVLATTFANFGAAGVPGWWAVLLVVVALATALWGANALVITSLFAFRARDVARLAVYFLFSAPRVALGNACLVVVAGGVTLVATEAALTLLGSVFAAALLLNGRPLIAEVTEKFTVQGATAQGDSPEGRRDDS